MSKHKIKSTAARKRARIRKLAQLVTNQAQLNQMLLDIPHRMTRREVYYMICPYLPFESKYPREIADYHKIDDYIPISTPPVIPS